MLIRQEAADLAAFLNGLIEVDQAFVQELIAQRLPCNDALASHPTVQVGVDDGIARAGVLDVLNGFLGVFDDGPKMGWGALTAIYEDDRLVRFAIAAGEASCAESAVG